MSSYHFFFLVFFTHNVHLQTEFYSQKPQNLFVLCWGLSNEWTELVRYLSSVACVVQTSALQSWLLMKFSKGSVSVFVIALLGTYAYNDCVCKLSWPFWWHAYSLLSGLVATQWLPGSWHSFRPCTALSVSLCFVVLYTFLVSKITVHSVFRQNMKLSLVTPIHQTV